jgi:hypothetical protein
VEAPYREIHLEVITVRHSDARRAVVGGRIPGFSTVLGTRLDPTLQGVVAAAWDLKDDLGDPSVVEIELLLYGTHDPDEGDEAFDIATGAPIIS